MPRRHVVQQGECLSVIARRYGFAKYRTVYDHPDNAELRKKRPNPNVLHPGDVVVIPDKEEKVANLATGKLHGFRVSRQKKALRLQIRDHDDTPLAGEPYVLEMDEQQREGKTDGDGRLEEPVRSATPAVLAIAGRKLHLRLGHLNPIEGTGDDVSGAQARLVNLGYRPGKVDGKLGPKTRTALALFQADENATIGGDLDDATRSALTKAHGC